MFNSYARMKRHTAIITNRRIIVAQKLLGSDRRVLQYVFITNHETNDIDSIRASSFAGGFFGNGFSTLLSSGQRHETVDSKNCLVIVPDQKSSQTMNMKYGYLFSDKIQTLTNLPK